MLIFNLPRVFALRGIANPYQQLVKLGISRPTAWNLLDNKVNSIQGKHLEKICEYLNCEPNDLYDWKPNKSTQNVETHPLKALRRNESGEQFRAMIRDLPLDKIAEAKTLLAGLTSSE
ncbi:MAG: helix-turn-helix transcriptional regulator [Pyrinomonadaceae bacterium]